MYKASLDKAAIIITLLISIVFGLIIYFQANQFVSILLVLTYFICLLIKPLKYEINANEIIIHRLIKNLRINRADIQSVKIIDKNALSGSIRTFGVGGLFGWIGKFRNSTLGSMTWHLTRRDKAVLIHTKEDKKILISPDEAENFIKEYDQRTN